MEGRDLSDAFQIHGEFGPQCGKKLDLLTALDDLLPPGVNREREEYAQDDSGRFRQTAPKL